LEGEAPPALSESAERGDGARSQALLPDRRDQSTTGEHGDTTSSDDCVSPAMPPTPVPGQKPSGQAPVTVVQAVSIAVAPRLWPSFQQEYDQLGPVEFSKRVTDFGLWLGSQRNLTTAEKATAYARYVFMQDRLNFWMSYSAKPARADDNLNSAAMFLFQGAINAGVVTDAGNIPASYVRAGLVAMQYEGPRLHVGQKPGAEIEETVPPGMAWRWPQELILGGVVNNKDVRNSWGRGINDQGGPWERYLVRQSRVGDALPERAKTFDAFDGDTGKATSAKTLDTTAYTYASNPKKVFSRLTSYINAMANYSRPRQAGDVNPNAIRQRVLEVAVPEYTSNAQREQLQAAVDYGRQRGVLVMVTVVANDPLVVQRAVRQAPTLAIRPLPPTQAAAAIIGNAEQRREQVYGPARRR